MNDKKRLLEIKEARKTILAEEEFQKKCIFLYSFDELGYLDWLIEQAEKVERYKQALEFYADEEHYKEKLISEAQYDVDGICISNGEYAPPIIYFDSGEIARKALEG